MAGWSQGTDPSVDQILAPCTKNHGHNTLARRGGGYKMPIGTRQKAKDSKYFVEIDNKYSLKDIVTTYTRCSMNYGH